MMCKHIELNNYFIKEKLHNGMICTTCVSTQNQLGILTKELNCINFERIISKLGMENTLLTKRESQNSVYEVFLFYSYHNFILYYGIILQLCIYNQSHNYQDLFPWNKLSIFPKITRLVYL